jgi:small subunit ribosomal protein S9
MEKANHIGATGRRKESVARANVAAGSGNFMINKRSIRDYLMRDALIQHATEPLELAEMAGKIDVICSANGGGLAGQAGAVRLALSRALIKFDPELSNALRKAGFLTRDPRSVERKKYGRPKARKRFQYSKR